MRKILCLALVSILIFGSASFAFERNIPRGNMVQLHGRHGGGNRGHRGYRDDSRRNDYYRNQYCDGYGNCNYEYHNHRNYQPRQ